LASHEASSRIRAGGAEVTLRARRDAADVLARARAVVHLSDGARFPSFAIAALAAGVPTCATSTAVNRELLEGAATLVDENDTASLVSAVEDLWECEPRRAVLIAAGRDRAADFSPDVAARAYVALYDALTRRLARA
jgi:glycosyltransferase involved in cell wall biosynthesis